jgi:hypothetical protein
MASGEKKLAVFRGQAVFLRIFSEKRKSWRIFDDCKQTPRERKTRGCGKHRKDNGSRGFPACVHRL